MTGTRNAQQAQRRDRVIAAAMALAAKGGYEAVQMRAVSQEADVALGTIYRYFSSKDQLLLAGLEQLAVEMHEQLRERPPKGQTIEERVGEVFRRCCALLEAEPQVTHAMVTAMSASDPSTAEPSSGVAMQLAAMIHEVLEGEDIAEIDGIVHVLGLVWFSSMIAWVGGRSPEGTMAAELELATRLLLRGAR
jgi:AcrR family transcriptional regulator